MKSLATICPKLLIAAVPNQGMRACQLPVMMSLMSWTRERRETLKHQRNTQMSLKCQQQRHRSWAMQIWTS